MITVSCIRPDLEDTIGVPAGQLVRNRNPDLLFKSGDVPYNDRPFLNNNDTSIPNVQWNEGSVGNWPENQTARTTPSDVDFRYTNYYELNGIAPLMTCKLIWSMQNDHDKGANDFDHSVARVNYVADNEFLSFTRPNCETQEEVNEFNKMMSEAFRRVVSGDFPGYPNLRNPSNLAETVGGLSLKGDLPPRVSYIGAGNDYDDTDNVPAQETGYYTPNFCRGFFHYDGREGTAGAPIEVIVLDPSEHCGLLEDDDWVYGPEQMAWAAEKMINSTADFILVHLGIQSFGSTSQGSNHNAWQYKPTERDAFFDLVKDVTATVAYFGGDFHVPHIVNYMPGDNAIVPTGHVNYCIAPFANRNVSDAGMLPENGVVWHDSLLGDNPIVALSETIVTQDKIVHRVVDVTTGLVLDTRVQYAGTKFSIEGDGVGTKSYQVVAGDGGSHIGFGADPGDVTLATIGTADGATTAPELGSSIDVNAVISSGTGAFRVWLSGGTGQPSTNITSVRIIGTDRDDTYLTSDGDFVAQNGASSTIWKWTLKSALKLVAGDTYTVIIVSDLITASTGLTFDLTFDLTSDLTSDLTG